MSDDLVTFQDHSAQAVGMTVVPDTDPHHKSDPEIMPDTKYAHPKPIPLAIQPITAATVHALDLCSRTDAARFRSGEYT